MVIRNEALGFRNAWRSKEKHLTLTKSHQVTDSVHHTIRGEVAQPVQPLSNARWQISPAGTKNSMHNNAISIANPWSISVSLFTPGTGSFNIGGAAIDVSG
jgi:hypothetical protein